MVLSAALSAVLLLALWWVADQTVRDTFESSTSESVDVDLAGLLDIYASGGIIELEQRIADRLNVVPTDGGRSHYMLTDGSGQKIIGDIDTWPELDPATSESGMIQLGTETQVRARATLLPGGLRLLVAHEPLDMSPLLNKISLVFLFGGMVFVIIVALFAIIASERIRGRVAGVSRAFRDGDEDGLAELISADSPDEIGQIASQAADAVKRAKHLTQAYRETSEQIAHEVRTPLMHLDSRLVKALEPGLERPVTMHLAEARSDIRRLVSTLESLLDIASSKASEGDMAGLKLFNVSDMVHGICELYQDSAEEAGYNFEWTVADGISVVGDEAQLGRLVTNLLDNAFKYNSRGGSIHLELAPGPRLCVSDDGPGIAETDRERIFDRFYRGTTTSNQQPGSGLGLALARAIAQRHGLSIELAPSLAGARFVVGPAAK